MTVRAVTFGCPLCGAMGISFFERIAPGCACRSPRYTRMIPLSKFPLMVVMRDE